MEADQQETAQKISVSSSQSEKSLWLAVVGLLIILVIRCGVRAQELPRIHQQSIGLSRVRREIVSYIESTTPGNNREQRRADGITNMTMMGMM